MKARELIARLKKNPDFVKAYEELEPQYQIAREIIRLRVERGWTQEQLAQKAGTRQANISRLENAVGTPSVSLLLRVAKALEARLCIRLEGRQQQSQPASVEQRMASLLLKAELPQTGKSWPRVDEEQRMWYPVGTQGVKNWPITSDQEVVESRSLIEAA